MPDGDLTPGAFDPAVTQENIATTICVRSWTRTVRLPEATADRPRADEWNGFTCTLLSRHAQRNRRCGAAAPRRDRRSEARRR
jgi:hypothetical protein